jgi:hypothetical protein
MTKPSAAWFNEMSIEKRWRLIENARNRWYAEARACTDRGEECRQLAHRMSLGELPIEGYGGTSLLSIAALTRLRITRRLTRE